MSQNPPKHMIYWFLRGKKPTSDRAANRLVKFKKTVGAAKDPEAPEALWDIDTLLERADHALASMSSGQDKMFDRGRNDSVFVNHKEWADMRAFGPYIPHEEAYGHTDRVKVAHGLPSAVFIGIDRERDGQVIKKNDAKFFYFIARRAQKLPWFIRPKENGVHYEFMPVLDWGKGTAGFRLFLTLTDKGTVVPCQRLRTRYSPLGMYARIPRRVWEDENWFHWDNKKFTPAHDLTLAINFFQNMEYHWYARVSDHRGTVQVSVTVEEAKRLFADRAVVKTKTGQRKRIIHWVKSHTRSTGSNVKTHFRGERDFFIKGKHVVIEMPGKHIDSRYSLKHGVTYDSAQPPWWAEISDRLYDKWIDRRNKEWGIPEETMTNPITGETFKYTPMEQLGEQR